MVDSYVVQAFGNKNRALIDFKYVALELTLLRIIIKINFYVELK